MSFADVRPKSLLACCVATLSCMMFVHVSADSEDVFPPGYYANLLERALQRRRVSSGKCGALKELPTHTYVYTARN